MNIYVFQVKKWKLFCLLKKDHLYPPLYDKKIEVLVDHKFVLKLSFTYIFQIVWSAIHINELLLLYLYFMKAENCVWCKISHE